jgi:hypothetical protein
MIQNEDAKDQRIKKQVVSHDEVKVILQVRVAIIARRIRGLGPVQSFRNLDNNASPTGPTYLCGLSSLQ